jgi:hypothetical protein
MNKPIRVGLTTPGIGDDKVSNPRRQPDPEICRTRYLGEYLPFSDCLVKEPIDCAHVLRAGFSFLCNHPKRRSFEKAGPSMPIQ